MLTKNVNGVDVVMTQEEEDAMRAEWAANEARIPIDLSDPANHSKALLALGLCIAQVGGLTIPQIKAMFKSKWDSLP